MYCFFLRQTLQSVADGVRAFSCPKICHLKEAYSVVFQLPDILAYIINVEAFLFWLLSCICGHCTLS